MAAELRGTAPAKVNLCLHLTGLRDDGYHLLESLVVFTEFGDALTLRAADDLTLTVDGPFALGVPTDGTNLVLKAAQHLHGLRGVTKGAAIHLTKHLPHGGGIGGGSSDAACAIRMLAELWDVPPLSGDEAVTLGADLPVCLAAPSPTIMRGIGDLLTPAPALPPCWLVLVNPRVSLPTGPMFALHDRLYPFSPLGVTLPKAFDDLEDFTTWLLGQRNDFTKVAQEPSMAPEVGKVLGALHGHDGCLDADMSGSGSTCWGLFATEAAAGAASAALAKAHPEWWVRASAVAG